MKTFILLPIFIIGASLNLYAKNLSDAGNNNQNPIANAGPDKTIYLTETSTVTLDGSSSVGDAFQWTEISTDYSSGASITAPNSKVTTVVGLPQGVFYFRLAATISGVTVKDSMKVIVDYDLPPRNSVLGRYFPIQDERFVALVNMRDDTLHHIGYEENANGYKHSLFRDAKGVRQLFLERSRLNSMMIDSLRGKFYTTLEDGYAWGDNKAVTGLTYARSQVTYGDYFKFDSAKTYVMYLKFYFPQSMHDNMDPIGMPDWGRAAISGMHGSDDGSGGYGVGLARDSVVFGGVNLGSLSVNLGSTNSFWNRTHTVKTTFRQGDKYPGQDAFLKVEVDGVLKYYNNTGKVGKTLMQDYTKLTGLYDYRRLLVNPDSLARGKKVSLVTLNADIYIINGVPTVDAGVDQSTAISSVNLSGTATDEGVSGNGKIVSYKWTKISGGAGTILNPNSPKTTVAGLTSGIYLFKLEAKDDSGISGADTMQVTVNAAANVAPTANAGSDKSITLPTNIITLSGSGSDTDGTIASYLWTKISGPSTFNIVNASLPVTDVSGLVQGVYTFQLKVADDKGATATSTVSITVNAAANVAPTANAGSDKSITLPTNIVTLSGSGSDTDGTIASYLWTKISGPSAFNIVNASSPVTDVSGLVQGVYTFQLKVADDKGATATSTVSITVNAAANVAPTANAGSDKSITLPTNIVTLSGSGSDTDGTIASYLWTKISGPSTFNIVNASSPVTDVSGLVQGVYTFQLKVADDKGATATSTVSITVNAAANVAPTANAGSDKSITLPTNIVTLSGSGSDTDGTIASYLWTKISGPSAFNILNASSPVTDVSGLIQGVYTFQLKVADDKGATATSTVSITVNAAANVAPTANAGSDKSITLPTNIITLSGSGSDTDGTIASYLWTKISGPSAFNILNASSPVTDVSGLIQGVYTFQLKVADDKGATATSTVSITVNAAANVAPTANAGSDKSITLPTNIITLSGSGSDTDGRIASYLWTKISGPSAFNILNASSPVTDVSGLVQGVYTFQLKVADDKGATATSTVSITVNAAANIAPTANAGSDKSITLPTNIVTFQVVEATQMARLLLICGQRSRVHQPSIL